MSKRVGERSTMIDRRLGLNLWGRSKSPDQPPRITVRANTASAAASRPTTASS